MLLAAVVVAVLQAQLLPDPGFDQGGWTPFESGFKTVPDGHRGQGILCRNPQPDSKTGASCTITLDQKEATPILVEGWSRADGVEGAADRDYAIYLDAVYQDGSPLWGTATPFPTGTHGWVRRQVVLNPAKPVKSLTVYALFRNHRGEASFDDFTARPLTGRDIFDGQPQSLGKPDKSLSIAGQPLEFYVKSRIEGVSRRFEVKGAKDDWIATARIADPTGSNAAVTVYAVLPVDAVGWQWWGDARRSRKIVAGREYIEATGTLSRYPFACISNGGDGWVIGNRIDQPSVCRLFYNASLKRLVAAWDFALVRPAKVQLWIGRLTPDEARWGFRAAIQRFYRWHPEAFKRRALQEGVWMPFTDPSTIANPADFGIAYHEGDNNLKGDDALHIGSYRYTEPMSYWMSMPPDEPRTYDNAVRILNKLAADGDASARATVATGTKDAQGRYNLQFRNEPWCNGAVFVLNPNPALKSTNGWPTKATINYDPTKVPANLDGEYLDSLEAWSETLDYRPEHLAASPYPAVFDSDGKPTLPQWYSTYAYADWLSRQLHAKNRLLMANSVPIKFASFAGLLDVMGIEVNWLSGDGVWQPDDDATFLYRRTMSGAKPYLLLQNTNFDRFTADHVRRYFERSAFYAVFPSFFSADAATHPYWENPALYNRDRALFKKVVPIVSRLSSAGWQPITYARSADPRIWVERYGDRLFTVFNPTGAEIRTTLTIDLPPLHRSPPKSVTELFTGVTIHPRSTKSVLVVPLTVGSERCLALRI